MTPSNPTTESAGLPSAQSMDPAAAFLGYLVPGLGQIVQGRVGKGLLFFIGVYGLFFYGLALGQFRNVFFGDTANPNAPTNLPRVCVNLYNRLQFAGQFWMGVAAWPAIYHYWTDPPTDSFDHRRAAEVLDKLPWYRQVGVAVPEEQLNRLQRDGDKRWDLGWVYTVIAGALNVLVMLDALAGPAFFDGHPEAKRGRPA